MLIQILGVVAVAAILIGLLIFYGKRSKDPTPMMGNGCNGDCKHCAVNQESKDSGCTK